MRILIVEDEVRMAEQLRKGGGLREFLWWAAPALPLVLLGASAGGYWISRRRLREELHRSVHHKRPVAGPDLRALRVAGVPLLVLDMYERSFHMDYGSAAARYVDAFMHNVNWEEVDRRYRRVLRMMAA